MTIDTFATITRRIIDRDGFDDFLPTACYPGRREVAVLEGAPSGVDVERATLDWASRKARDDEEFLVAFRSSPDCFKVVRLVNGESEEVVYSLRTA